MNRMMLVWVMILFVAVAGWAGKGLAESDNAAYYVYDILRNGNTSRNYKLYQEIPFCNNIYHSLI